MARDLTIKQKSFVAAYLETGNASEAYRRAYDCKSMSEKSIGNQAYKLMNHPEIAPKIEKKTEEIVEAAKERAEVTIESLSDMLLKAYSKADETGQTSSMVGAAMGMGKLHGLIVDKKADVTPAKAPADVDSRIYQLAGLEQEDGTAEPSGRAGEMAPDEPVKPTVPGHGTA